MTTTETETMAPTMSDILTAAEQTRTAADAATSVQVPTSPSLDLLGIDEAAAYLHIPKATLYTWRTRRPGYGPKAHKFGKNLRFFRADLDSWVAQQIEVTA